MSRRFVIIGIYGLIFTFGIVAESFAQPASSATTSTSRRSSLFGASRVGLFNASGERGIDRDTIKSRRLEGADSMVQMLDTNDPSRMLDAPGVSNMSLFLTTGSAIQRVFNLNETTTTAIDSGRLVIGDIDTTVNAVQATTINRTTGIYSPRLRFVKDPEILTAEQIAETNQLRAAGILNDIINKFDLSPASNLTLDFNGFAIHLQGRVANPVQRKRIEMYLGFEPGIYSVKNDLVVDPSLVENIDANILR
ncbi:MAG: hypothetical protein LBT05_11570 [Planctomycetaceae bacterium]|jgi:hypothetical protein|nr:hypothetical protein [Planctomycetaceae bacterium]